MKKQLGFGVLFLLFIILLSFSDWIMEWIWLDNLGYEQVFMTIKTTQILLLAGALLVALLYVLPNMHFLAKQFPSFSFGNSPLGQLDLSRFNESQFRKVLFGIGTLISLFFAFAFFMRWDTYFRFHWNETFNQVDPVFGNDLGFYLFRLPFIEIIQNSMIVLVFFITFLLLLVYIYSGALSIQGKSGIMARSGITKHLSLNVGFWLLLLSWGYYLERYRLLYSESGVVYGASYTDIYVQLPVLWILCFATLLLALIAFFQIYKRQFRLLMIGGVVTVGIGILGLGVLPAAVQKFIVEPNELELETPYMENNIEQTRQAYDLDSITERNYDAGGSLTWEKLQDNQATLDNIRLWDPRLLIQTYRQLQEIRLYYQFFNVDVDRYHTNEGYLQMMLSARELSNDLPEQADTWVNRHLQYTHGYGLVMSPVAQEGQQGDPRLVIKDLPPVSELNLEVTQPSIYYGENDPGYKIVNTDVQELDYPKGDENVYTSYDGEGGVSIDNFFEKLLYAYQFGDMNMLLTDYIRDGSKIQFWRGVQERVRRIAPFLRFEDDPYLVLSDGKLYWMQDAYTTSKDYPYSETSISGINYIRNSVKVVVDAYNGSVDFYAVDEDDPVLKVYRDIFPDMFKTLDEMPEGFKDHVRYPKTLFEIQMEMYNTYHMTNPQVFYNNEDLWTRPNEKYGGEQLKMEPYPLLTKLPGEEELQYVTISPLTPNNRDNMIAWMVARSDFPYYGQVEVFKLPKERLILGPAQIEAKIDQDTDISRQLSLWDQRGSQVIRGNLMVLPIEDAFLYVEPVFLIADDLDIPQLQRVIATTGERVVMEPTLDMALEQLFGKSPPTPVTPQPIAAQADTTTMSTAQVIPASTQEFNEVQKLWEEAQQALNNGNWQQWGEKMDQIKELLGQN
ncbi:UPF0182 family protein [Aliifodinibius sp. S!AR15-10]|uniref:UPF0182 family membrane protein n=1 Tax=Aliifodinibius sp. S!AR15-10 TaxID=2950437 RepID=UPI002854A6B4|nr:UPF0182 family protein [Aliifodinibius sp. S!AR15-10]MDR8392609.1 UPF0182 family protein [Aliifodinibius sp. S!AR15-10]